MTIQVKIGAYPKRSFIFFPESPPSLVNLNNVQDLGAWMEDPRNLYVGRKCNGHNKASYWQNPFRISSSCSRENAISKYRVLLEQDMEMQSKLISLSNKNLGCWCLPLPCHGEILINAFKELIMCDEHDFNPAPIST